MHRQKEIDTIVGKSIDFEHVKMGAEYSIYPEFHRLKIPSYFELTESTKQEEQQKMRENKAIIRQVGEAMLPEEV